MSHFKTFKKSALTHQSVFHETADYTLFGNKRSEERVTKLYTGLCMKLEQVIPFSKIRQLSLPRSNYTAAKTLMKK